MCLGRPAQLTTVLRHRSLHEFFESLDQCNVPSLYMLSNRINKLSAKRKPGPFNHGGFSRLLDPPAVFDSSFSSITSAAHQPGPYQVCRQTFGYYEFFNKGPPCSQLTMTTRRSYRLKFRKSISLVRTRCIRMILLNQGDEGGLNTVSLAVICGSV